MAELDYAHF